MLCLFLASSGSVHTTCGDVKSAYKSQRCCTPNSASASFQSDDICPSGSPWLTGFKALRSAMKNGTVVDGTLLDAGGIVDEFDGPDKQLFKQLVYDIRFTLKREWTPAEIETFTAMGQDGKRTVTKTVNLIHNIISSDPLYASKNGFPTSSNYFSGKTLVVGGVSSGIGFAMAVRFAQLGGQVFGFARTCTDWYELHKHTSMLTGAEDAGMSSRGAADAPAWLTPEWTSNNDFLANYVMKQKDGTYLRGLHGSPLYGGPRNVHASVFDKIDCFEADIRLEPNMHAFFTHVRTHTDTINYAAFGAVGLGMGGKMCPREARKVIRDHWNRADIPSKIGAYNFIPRPPLTAPFDVTLVENTTAAALATPNHTFSQGQEAGTYESWYSTNIRGLEIAFDQMTSIFGWEHSRTHTTMIVLASNNALSEGIASTAPETVLGPNGANLNFNGCSAQEYAYMSHHRRVLATTYRALGFKAVGTAVAAVKTAAGLMSSMMLATDYYRFNPQVVDNSYYATSPYHIIFEGGKAYFAYTAAEVDRYVTTFIPGGHYGHMTSSTYAADLFLFNAINYASETSFVIPNDHVSTEIDSNPLKVGMQKYLTAIGVTDVEYKNCWKVFACLQGITKLRNFVNKLEGGKDDAMMAKE